MEDKDLESFQDFEDFHLEDLVQQSQRKKKLNSKKKGNRAELELVKLLTERFGKPFSRTVASGARILQANLSEEAKNIFSGDLVVPKGFAYVIEAKNGYDSIDLNAAFDDGHKELDAFLKQAVRDGESCHRKPMLCWKKTRKPWLAFIHAEELKDYDFKYRICYNEWIGVSLNQLLKLEDDFFFVE